MSIYICIKQIVGQATMVGAVMDMVALHRLSRNVDRLYMSRKSQLTQLCENIKSYTIIVDFWTESYTGKECFSRGPYGMT